MSLLDQVPEGVAIGLDTAPIIYLLEEHPRYAALVEALFCNRFDASANSAVTSAITVAEVLVKPLEEGRADIAEKYRDCLYRNPSLKVIPLDWRAAERAAALRARYRIRLPDALQIAAALEGGATHFVTNDARLRRVSELKVLVLEDYVEPLP